MGDKCGVMYTEVHVFQLALSHKRFFKFFTQDPQWVFILCNQPDLVYEKQTAVWSPGRCGETSCLHNRE